MRLNPRRDTGPELAVRSCLHRDGLRFFVDRSVRFPSGVVRPDIIFPTIRVAVFIDGCFWHGCPDHGTNPQRNRDYWGPKLARNRARDVAVDMGLRSAGWQVLRHWEHEEAERVAAHVATVCKRSRATALTIGSRSTDD